MVRVATQVAALVAALVAVREAVQEAGLEMVLVEVVLVLARKAAVLAPQAVTACVALLWLAPVTAWAAPALVTSQWPACVLSVLCAHRRCAPPAHKRQPIQQAAANSRAAVLYEASRRRNTLQRIDR